MLGSGNLVGVLVESIKCVGEQTFKLKCLKFFENVFSVFMALGSFVVSTRNSLSFLLVLFSNQSLSSEISVHDKAMALFLHVSYQTQAHYYNLIPLNEKKEDTSERGVQTSSR
jgi:hypothetical protein